MSNKFNLLIKVAKSRHESEAKHYAVVQLSLHRDDFIGEKSFNVVMRLYGAIGGHSRVLVDYPYTIEAASETFDKLRLKKSKDGYRGLYSVSEIELLNATIDLDAKRGALVSSKMSSREEDTVIASFTTPEEMVYRVVDHVRITYNGETMLGIFSRKRETDAELLKIRQSVLGFIVDNYGLSSAGDSVGYKSKKPMSKEEIEMQAFMQKREQYGTVWGSW